MEGFLPELGEAAPEAHVSMIREEAVHVSPADFLRGGVLKRGAFRAEARHAAWVFAGAPSGPGLGCSSRARPSAFRPSTPPSPQDDGGERRRVLRHSDLHERLWGIGTSSVSIHFARNW
jgi:hypothetical protein